ncbi:S8 family peptidase [Clostridium tyrobutyricum]|uniref:S8 family peptidase n=1 Tax=Clostridium tyrobutyricum TaxID=1519 RepID=UPI001C3950D0|nr:S8 family peptidase [Clostridium tyrobutyricum]MBV4420158.1 S8 family peptidase [Clostridium tyrobutyricum]
MAINNKFGHLPLPMMLQGRPKINGNSPNSQKTLDNRKNRNIHGQYMTKRSVELSRFWIDRRSKRKTKNLPKIKSGIPILLEIDTNSDIDFLRGLGFEIITELKDGFIIVCSEDIELKTLNEKIDNFIKNINSRCNSPAKIYALCEDNDRLKNILSKELYEKWDEIGDNDKYSVDISVSCTGGIKLPNKPFKGPEETGDHYKNRLNNWEKKFNDAYMKWDDLKSEREDIITEFVSSYDGEILNFIDGTSDITKLPDSFSTRLNINGKCLKDLALNFAYVFEITISKMISVDSSSKNSQSIGINVEIIPPQKDWPKVCVIDSGIQEKHKYISQAIISNESMCLIPEENSVGDEVNYGGHGTRVAGAILYPNKIPISGTYYLPCWIRNIRVLDKDNIMRTDMYPPKIIEYIIDKYSNNRADKSKIFNHSIGTYDPFELIHMSSWAATIDLQSYENDILFIQAAGNIKQEVIKSYIKAGYNYPDYLYRELSRISDPGQSLQAITVGSISINDYKTPDASSLGNKDEISAFSRSGPGIWDVIKPDVVEYGGTYVKGGSMGNISLTTPKEVCPELIRKSPEGPPFAQDEIGTSFSTPKVTNIAAEIQKILPDSSTLLYRALIAQSARWPEWTQYVKDTDYNKILRNIGYGIPNVVRATQNNEYRVTLITDKIFEIGEKEAHIFRIPIPEELSSIGEDYNILIEITLSYAAKPKRTRRTVKRYLSTWLDWCCSRIGEDYSTFARRVFETGSSIEDDGDFKWTIGDATNHGKSKKFSRKNGTLQKDWTIVKSNQLTDAFCIAVRGHKGWGSLFKAKYALAVSIEAIDQNIEIYESIKSMIDVNIETPEIEVELGNKDI